MMRRKAGLVGIMTLLLAFVAIEAHGADDLVKVGNVGWWSKRPAAQPTAGPTSFEVASGIDGDESVAALRLLIYGSVTKATLTITEAPNQATSISVPKLQVCPTDTPWVITTSPGAYADAPKPACDRVALPLTRASTGAWTADVTGLLSGARSEVSVMVVPAPDSTLPVPPTFFVQFATSLVSADGTLDSPLTPPTVPVAAPPAQSGGSANAPRPAVTPATATPATATPATAPTPTTTAAPPSRLGGVRVASTHKPKQWGKLVWVLPLSALLALGYARLRRVLLERGVVAATS